MSDQAGAGGAPRITPGSRAELGLVNSLIARAIGRATGGRPPNIFTTLGRHRRLFRGWLRFAARLMPRGTLARRDTELVILRVAHNCGCEYEWRHHELIGARVGLTEEEIARVRSGPGADAWSAGDAALLRGVDEMHSDRRAISDETWAALATRLSDTQMIELCLLAGHYEMLAMTLNSLRVEPDEAGGRKVPRVASTVAAAMVVATGGLAAGSAPARASLPAFAGAHGISIASQHQIDNRLIELSVNTDALPEPANVRVLLPGGYSSHPRKHYPVLYLFHGTSGGAKDWTVAGNAEETTDGLPLIVVMPDIDLNYDGGGYCTNWPSGKYRWERFHIDQIVPWIDGNLRTVRSRGGRAVAGLSQGGFCSTSYATRHPDLFGIAFSYSGVPDIAYDATTQAGTSVIFFATEMFLDGEPPNSIFGDRVSNEINYAAHDPATLAENLRDTELHLYTGNGLPGPLDPDPTNVGASAIEGAAWQDNEAFVRRLDSLGIPSDYQSYGNGTHTWPYWARDLEWSIDPLMAYFANPPAKPKTISYTSGDDRYSVYGWRVATHRRARELSTISGAGRSGFTLAGSGSATVATPRSHVPGRRYRVVTSGGGGSETKTVRARRSGRLVVEVPLGPSNPYQQYTPQATAAGTKVFETRVAISPAG